MMSEFVTLRLGNLFAMVAVSFTLGLCAKPLLAWAARVTAKFI